LYEYIDGELTDERAAEVRAHLAQCGPCMAVSGFEEAFVRFLEARTRARKVPDELRKRVLDELLFKRDDP
jgi:anti-sigma factor (TIGR02949 family)